jgi:hypothetical protein
VQCKGSTDLKHNTEGFLDQTLVRYRGALDIIRNLGVQIPQQSRLLTYEKRWAAILQQPNELLLLPEADATQIMFEFREMDEISFIAESLPSYLNSEEMDRLQLIAGGNQNPDEDKDTKARDTQFELFLRAAFIRAGANVILGSPDLMVTFNDVEFPLEAKRPSSERAFDARLREGANQIHRLNRFGVVALSVDQIIRPRGGFLLLKSTGDLAPGATDLLRDFMRKNIRVMEKRVRGKRVAATLLVVRLPGRTEDRNLTLLGTVFMPQAAVRPGEPEYSIYEAIERLAKKMDV